MGKLYRIDFAQGKLVPVESAESKTPLVEVVHVGDTKPATPESPKYVPAYCDPKNETRGAKYDRDRRPKECAAAFRADVKAAQKAGTLPRDLKVSVRYRSFSGGSSIDVEIVKMPAGVPIYNRERLVFETEHPHEPPPRVPWMSEEASVLVEQLKRMMNAYNRDNSDTMVDYFDVHFYSHVEIGWELRDAERRVVAAKKAAP
jgi:hypothetical protein